MYLVVPPGGSFPETRRIELGPGALTIGRAEECEIRVDVPGVDQEHAKISEVALVALGPDCAIGDVPLDSGCRRLVMPGDEIQIGSVVVVLEGDDPSLSIAPPAAQVTQRMGHAQQYPQAAPPMEAPRIRVVEGSNFGDELLLKEEGRAYLVGRGSKCDLVVDDREVSREHVKVMRKGYAVFVQDLSSTRGSWLGRSAVYTGATVEWSRPRMLRVGATVLSLELPEAIRKAAPAAQASAPMTPPPRSRRNLTPVAPGVRGNNALTPAPSQPPAGSPAAMATAADEASTRQLPAYTYEATPPPPPGRSVVVVESGGGGAAAPPPAAPPPAPGSAPRALGMVPAQSRKAWKKNGPTIGKASGLLLLALAGLVILGGLFVVFSLLE